MKISQLIEILVKTILIGLCLLGLRAATAAAAEVNLSAHLAATGAEAHDLPALPEPGKGDPRVAVHREIREIDADGSAKLLNLSPDIVAKLDSDELGEIIRLKMRQPATFAEVIFNTEVIVPFIVFASMTAVAFAFAYSSYRKRRDFLSLVEKSLEQGNTLPESLLESIQKTKRTPGPDADLRRAVLLLALGISSAIIVANVGIQNGARLASIGLLPSLLGIAYFFLWRHSLKRQNLG